jgi:hypothetical protein
MRSATQQLPAGGWVVFHAPRPAACVPCRQGQHSSSTAWLARTRSLTTPPARPCHRADSVDLAQALPNHFTSGVVNCPKPTFCYSLPTCGPCNKGDCWKGKCTCYFEATGEQAHVMCRGRGFPGGGGCTLGGMRQGIPRWWSVYPRWDAAGTTQCQRPLRPVQPKPPRSAAEADAGGSQQLPWGDPVHAGACARAHCLQRLHRPCPAPASCPPLPRRPVLQPEPHTSPAKLQLCHVPRVEGTRGHEDRMQQLFTSCSGLAAAPLHRVPLCAGRHHGG